MPPLRHAYPALFAVFPVLTLAADHIGQFYLADLLTVVGASAALGVAAWLALRALPWKGDRSAIGALLAFFGVFLFFYAFPLAEVIDDLLPGLRQRWTVPALAAGSLLAAWWVIRRRALLARATLFLAVTGLILVAQASVRLGAGMARAPGFIEQSELARELARPVPVREESPSGAGPQRDIFLIILDMYADAEVLEEVFRYDNGPFLDSLRTLGFTLPKVRSNYTRTILSLASILNMDHMDRIADELGPRSRDRSLGRYLTENNRAVAFLKERGYRFHFFPPLWGGLTRENRHADFRFQPRRGPVEALVAESSLHRELWRTTALGRFVTGEQDRHDVEATLESFARLRETPDTEEPLFVFAHFMVPHGPFIFDESCRPAQPPTESEVPSGLEPHHVMYIEQLECVNRQVFDFLPTLLARSPAPIILLQSDHGTRTVRDYDPDVHERVPYHQARERHGAFGAYYLPDGEGIVPESITTVNLLRYVFSHYFGADLPPVSDGLFYSDGDYELEFLPVEPSPSREAAG